VVDYLRLGDSSRGDGGVNNVWFIVPLVWLIMYVLHMLDFGKATLTQLLDPRFDPP